jgi:hypothetical protein
MQSISLPLEDLFGRGHLVRADQEIDIIEISEAKIAVSGHRQSGSLERNRVDALGVEPIQNGCRHSLAIDGAAVPVDQWNHPVQPSQSKEAPPVQLTTHQSAEPFGA